MAVGYCQPVQLKHRRNLCTPVCGRIEHISPAVTCVNRPLPVSPREMELCQEALPQSDRLPDALNRSPTAMLPHQQAELNLGEKAADLDIDDEFLTPSLNRRRSKLNYPLMSSAEPRDTTNVITHSSIHKPSPCSPYYQWYTTHITH